LHAIVIRCFYEHVAALTAFPKPRAQVRFLSGALDEATGKCFTAELGDVGLQRLEVIGVGGSALSGDGGVAAG